MGSCHLRIVIVLVIILLGGLNNLYAQTPSSYLYENEFDLSIPLDELWSIEVGIGSRGLLTETVAGETSGYQHQHIEVNHFTNYQLSASLVLSLGLRYRVKDIFDPAATNEFRTIQQISYENPDALIAFEHRLRLEQRFREHSIHRMRYELAFIKPINNVFSWLAATEALYAVSAQLKPEAEQRFSLGLENTSFKGLELELIFQYRIEDYARNPGHEFFLITGVSLEL